MLRDKDIRGVIAAVKPHVDEWLVSGIDAPRGADAAVLREELARAGILQRVSTCDSIETAYAQACGRAAPDDRIVVFGSFHTVAAVVALRRNGETS